MSPFVALLRSYMDAQGLTASDFARRVHRTPQSVSAILRGERRPNPDECVIWSRALHLSGERAATFEDEMVLAACPERIQKLVERLRRGGADPGTR